MSLKNNILANYVSQIYVTLIGIVIVPLYIKYMGGSGLWFSRFFCHVTSITYGDHPGLPKVEDKIGNPLSPYAVTNSNLHYKH